MAKAPEAAQMRSIIKAMTHIIFEQDQELAKLTTRRVRYSWRDINGKIQTVPRLSRADEAALQARDLAHG
jgi:hypothetical protein